MVRAARRWQWQQGWQASERDGKDKGDGDKDKEGG